MGPQVSGKQFENFFEKIALVRGFFPIRIPNGFQITKSFPLRGFPLKTPFDYILEHDELGIAFLDLKTHATKKYPTCLIKPHQIRDLERLSIKHVSGFLVWFRKVDKVVYFRAEYAKNNGNLVMEDGLDIGSLHEMDLEKLMIKGNNSSNCNASKSPNNKIGPG
jgi:hypothetical protein